MRSSLLASPVSSLSLFHIHSLPVGHSCSRSSLLFSLFLFAFRVRVFCLSIRSSRVSSRSDGFSLVAILFLSHLIDVHMACIFSLSSEFLVFEFQRDRERLVRHVENTCATPVVIFAACSRT